METWIFFECVYSAKYLMLPNKYSSQSYRTTIIILCVFAFFYGASFGVVVIETSKYRAEKIVRGEIIEK